MNAMNTQPTGERPSRRLTFADLRVGETFEFSAVREFPYSGMARGPWVKTSARKYARPGMQCHVGSECRVGSVKAGVFRVPLCACSDPGCPVCAGKCTHKATTAVRRIDMEDRTGTPMCAQCAADALDSGLFADEPWLLRFHR
jgi:hypothetical protein